MINRKLNTTPLLPSEVIPGCEFRMGIETYVVTSVEGELYTAELLQRSWEYYPPGAKMGNFEIKAREIENYESHVVPIERLRPIDLWDYNNTLTDYLMKSLDFIREPLGIYRRMVGGSMVVVKDCFYLDDCAKLSVFTAKGDLLNVPLFYFHELQGAIYQATGQMLYTPMGKRLMLTKRAIE